MKHFLEVGSSHLSLYVDGKISAVLLRTSMERRAESRWIKTDHPTWQQFCEMLKEHFDYTVAPGIRPSWTWIPDVWAREYMKTYGRVGLRAKMERFEKANAQTALALAACRLLHEHEAVE